MIAKTQLKNTDNSQPTSEPQVAELRLEIAKLQRQVAWFQRQLFGRKSEKRIFDSPMQETLSGLFPEEDKAPEPSKTITIEEHTRKKKELPGTPGDSGLRFNEKEVPVV